MIQVTRFDGTHVVLNANLIEHIEANPDTVITLVNRKKWVVKETADEVVDMVVNYQRALYSAGPARIIPFTVEGFEASEVDEAAE